MDKLFNLTRGYRWAKKTSKISIRIEPEVNLWLKKQNLSPTKIFDNAVLRLRKRKKW